MSSLAGSIPVRLRQLVQMELGPPTSANASPKNRIGPGSIAAPPFSLVGRYGRVRFPFDRCAQCMARTDSLGDVSGSSGGRYARRRRDVELREHLVRVGLDCAWTQEQLGCDLRIGHPL
jgi:hypothetical protein